MVSKSEIVKTFLRMRELGITSCKIEQNSFLEIRYIISQEITFKDKRFVGLVDEINGIKILPEDEDRTPPWAW
jgi:hypothetical protein